MFPGVHARRTPDRTAVVMNGSGARLTYRELDEGSARLARYLHDRGLRRGDVIALVADNSPRVFEVYWAAQRSGLYVTAVNHHLAASEISYILRDSGSRAIVISEAIAVSAAVELGPAVSVRLVLAGEVAGFDDYDKALAQVPAEPLPDQPRGADLLYSSGTTGRPKGIKPSLPDRQVDEPGDTSVTVLAPRYGFDAHTVYLSPAPLYHSAPLRYGATVQALGGTVVVMERFDAEAALAAIERYRVTHSQWVPTMFVRMLKLPEAIRRRYDLSSHRVAIHAAAPCPPHVKRAMIDWWGPVVHEYYAATEANGTTFIDSHEWLAKPGSVGRPGLGEIRICDDEGTLLPPGEIGTVYFARDELPFRYHGDDAKTRAAQHPEHPTWTTTGDLGYVDKDGYLFLTDRKSFTIISGGVNIYPREIEDCLLEHPEVIDAAVIGIPDEDLGEAVLAVVKPVASAAFDQELPKRLVAHCRDRIARFKVPRRVEVVDKLPRTPTGKLVKRSLQERYAATSHDTAMPNGTPDRRSESRVD
jgi:long-chain acyl-CoA synthetase